MKLTMTLVKDVTKRFIRTTGTEIFKHRSDLLIGMGIAGGFFSAFMAVEATPKAVQRIEEEEAKEERPLTNSEKVKVTWKLYAPAVASSVISAGCIVGAHILDNRSNAALMAAYSISEKHLADYQKKVLDSVGPEKEEEVRQAIDKDAVDANPPFEDAIIYTDGGHDLIYDKLTGRYFYGSVNSIEKAVNDFNRMLLDEMYGSMNDLYGFVGLPEVDAGDLLGWQIEKGQFEVSFTSQLTPDNKPCIVVTYPVAPEYSSCSYYS